MEQIKIQLGSVIMNKTAKFIKPVLRTYGQDFIKKMGAVFKLAYGIGDMYIQKKYEQHLFILIDTKRCINHWISTLEWLRDQDYYEDDYAFDELATGRLHMLVIKLPEGVDLQMFIKGKYSQMYTKKELIALLDDESKSIVIKDYNYRIKFAEKLNKQFGSNIKVSELAEDAELEIPPTIDDQQIF